MTVWDVDDAARRRARRRRSARCDCVTPLLPAAAPAAAVALQPVRDGARPRPRRGGGARSRGIAALLGDAGRAHDILYSTRILKKTGLRFAAEPMKSETAMFRVTQFLQEVRHPTPLGPEARPARARW